MERSRAALVLTLVVTLLAHVDSLSATPVLVDDHRHGEDGTCHGTSFSSPTGLFSAADLGKVMVISGDSATIKSAGDKLNILSWGNAPLFTTIVAVNNSTSITLGDSCNVEMEGVNTAQWDMGTDNTAALQSCLQAGTCNVPKGTGSYLMSGSPVGNPTFNAEVIPPSNSQLLCEPGATFVFPHHGVRSRTNGSAIEQVAVSFLILLDVHDVTISGCTIQGTNLRGIYTDGIASNFAIVLSAGATSNRIVGNTIKDGWSNGDILVYQQIRRSAIVPPPVATQPANNRIAENFISNCGYNGIAIVSGIGNLVENNTLTDCNLDIEPEAAPAEPVVGNVLRGNRVIQATRQATPPGQPSDPRGFRHGVFFSSCAVAACDMAGGATVVAENNTFVNDVLVYPYCRQGAVSQVWLNNSLSSTNGVFPRAPGCDLSAGSRMKASPAALSIITSEVLAR